MTAAAAILMLAFCSTLLRHNDVVVAFTPPSSSPSDRRNIIKQIISASTAASAALLISASADPALAVAPFAPVDALLPAARVKIMIDRSVYMASKLKDAEDNVAIKQSMLHDLEHLLLTPQNFTRGTTPIEVPQQPAKSYLDAYDNYRKSVSILEKPGAMLVQNGEIDAWKRLKRQEKAREDADEIRAALNYYTSNINFNSGKLYDLTPPLFGYVLQGCMFLTAPRISICIPQFSQDKFILTGSKNERSKLIREDRIPDVKTVIASDMGLRYLFRNDILTACDDARAELKYQVKQADTEAAAVDGRELLDLLLVAQSACNKWLDLIDEKSVQEALATVSKEE